MIFNDLWSLRFCFYIFEFKSVYVFCWWVVGHILGLLKLFFLVIMYLTTHQRGGGLTYNRSSSSVGSNKQERNTTSAATIFTPWWVRSQGAVRPSSASCGRAVGVSCSPGPDWERWPPQDTSLPSLHLSPYSVFCLHRRLAPCKKKWRFFIDLTFKEWCDVTGGSTKKAGQKKEESSTSTSTTSEPASWPAFKWRSTPQGDLFRYSQSDLDERLRFCNWPW